MNRQRRNPYASQAQRRFFHAAAARGEISKKVVREYDRESKGLKLPERVRRKHNPFSEANDTAAHELALYAENDSGLYHRHRRAIEKNLVKKMQRGVYDHAKALIIWEHFATFAAKQYVKEFGSDGQPYHHIFSAATRRLAAKHFREVFEDEAKVQGIWR